MTLNLNNVTLDVVFHQIEIQTGIPISYSLTQIPIERRVSIRIKNKPVELALEEICKPHGLTYVLIENQYIIKPLKEDIDSEIQKSQIINKYTFSGYIYDKQYGDVIPGAVVYTIDLKYGTVANGYGFFSITLPEGKYVFLSSSLGFRTDTLYLTLNKNQTYNFYLNIEEYNLEPIEIKQIQDSTYLIIKNILGFDHVSPSSGSCAPVVFSEPDILKTLHLIPGVKNTVDGSTFYLVRGGERDQNLIVLDDAPLYNPSHLFGIFSTINPETLSEIQFYKCDYPFSLGGRLSSVLELRTRDGNKNKLSISGDLNFVTNRLNLEFPVFKKNGSIYFSLHGSHIENIAKRILPNVYKFRFGDVQQKMNLQINTKNRLYFAFYGSSDKFLFQNDSDIRGIQWGNFLTSLRWNKLWGSKVFSNATFYISSYSYELYQSFATNTLWNSAIVSAAIKNDWYAYPSTNATHYFGVHLLGHKINPGIVISDIQEIRERFEKIEQLNTAETILYYGCDRHLNVLWRIKYGLRYISFANIGPAKYYIFDEHFQISDSVKIIQNLPYNHYRVLEPSLTLTRIVDEFQSLKFNYLNRNQFIQTLSNSISPFTTLEIWYPATVNIKPQSMHQFTSGWYYFVKSLRSTFSIEIFYRLFRNQIEYQNQANLVLNPLLEQQIRQYHGFAYGFDLILKKEIGNVQGWFGYSFTRVKRKFMDSLQIRTYRGTSDRPIDFSCFVRWQPKQRSVYSIGMICASGLPITVPTGYYYYHGYYVPIYDEKNNWRLPSYFRIDVSAQWMLNKPDKKFNHYLTISIYNLTGRKNPSFISFGKIEGEDENFVTPSNFASMLQLQPTQTYLFGFIPSLKYSFRL